MPEPDRVIWTEGETPEPVTPMTPLMGLETEVLRVWMESSPKLRKAYQSSPQMKQDLESAARLAVHAAHVEELQLRAKGMQQHEAEEFTRPAVWTPPM